MSALATPESPKGAGAAASARRLFALTAAPKPSSSGIRLVTSCRSSGRSCIFHGCRLRRDGEGCFNRLRHESAGLLVTARVSRDDDRF
jgi:hypothetical protein